MLSLRYPCFRSFLSGKCSTCLATSADKNPCSVRSAEDKEWKSDRVFL